MSGYLTQQIWRDHPQRVLGIGLVATTERPATINEQHQFQELIGRIARDWPAHAPAIAQILVGSGFRSSNPAWLDRWTDHIGRHYDLPGMARLVAAINRRPDYSRPPGRSTSRQP